MNKKTKIVKKYEDSLEEDINYHDKVLGLVEMYEKEDLSSEEKKGLGEIKYLLEKVKKRVESQHGVLERMMSSEELDHYDIRALDDYIPMQNFETMDIESEIKKLETSLGEKKKEYSDEMLGMVDSWIDESDDKNRIVDEFRSIYKPKKTVKKPEKTKKPKHEPKNSEAVVNPKTIRNKENKKINHATDVLTNKSAIPKKYQIEIKQEKPKKKPKNRFNNEVKGMLENIKKYKKDNSYKKPKKKKISPKRNTLPKVPTPKHYDEIVTLDKMTKAIENEIGLPKEQARKNAEHVLDIMGFDDRVIDNSLDQEDRQAFYIMEEHGFLTTEREETKIYDDREWRTHYWRIEKGNIFKSANNGKKKKGGDRKKSEEEKIYEELDDTLWKRNN